MGNNSSDIVVFGEDWGRHPSSTQHLFRFVAEEHPVHWVNSIGLRAPRASVKDVLRLGGKLASFTGAKPLTNPAATPPKLRVHSPKVLPYHDHQFATRANSISLKRQLGALNAPILWATLPSAAPYIEALGPKAVIYYVCDDYAALPHVDADEVKRHEAALVKRADLIIATDEALASRYPQAKTRILPHGVDLGQFMEPAAKAEDLPIGKPIAGFYGSVADWVDLELIAKTARDLPNWNFVLIGQIETDISPLKRLQNVHLLGPRAHMDLPSYVQHWQVSMLPFKDCPQIRACNPLKLREYLAAGKPIAATPFPALEPYRSLVHVTGKNQDFMGAICAAGRDRRDTARQELVMEDSWQSRADTVTQWLKEMGK